MSDGTVVFLHPEIARVSRLPLTVESATNAALLYVELRTPADWQKVAVVVVAWTITGHRSRLAESAGNEGTMRGCDECSVHKRSTEEFPHDASKCYCPGDVVVFHIGTIHGGLDNQSRRVRLSTDSRYQRASELADERWTGENPIGHGADARRGIIC